MSELLTHQMKQHCKLGISTHEVNHSLTAYLQADGYMYSPGGKHQCSGLMKRMFTDSYALGWGGDSGTRDRHGRKSWDWGERDNWYKDPAGFS